MEPCYRSDLFLRISGCPVCNPWKNRLYCQNNCFDFNCHIDIDCNRFCEWLPGMVGTVCVPGGDHFSRCWYYHLYDRKPQKLAELYDVADFYDFMQHCSGNTDFYRYRDGTAFCTDRICVFPVSVSWNTDHRRPQGKGGTETKISCPLSYI